MIVQSILSAGGEVVAVQVLEPLIIAITKLDKSSSAISYKRHREKTLSEITAEKELTIDD